jgi:monovalent cation:H+ antiporter, CPA1 family
MTATSTIQVLILLLIIASVLAVVAIRFRIPYTVVLVLGGLFLGSVRIPVVVDLFQGQEPSWFTPDLILICFLPALLFEGSVKINFRLLRENLTPILILANFGVLIATLITGYVLHWAMGIPLAITLVFGAIISATDPVSVLAIFRELTVTRRLSLLVEAESLLNDGTAVVLFQVLLGAYLSGQSGIAFGLGHFLESVLGGSTIGFAFGYLMSFITSQIDDAQIEITLTTIVAYGSYVVANHFGLSGVLATVVAGITVGNIGARQGMSARTRVALFSFWDYVAFLINSLVFLLVGIEVHINDLFGSWRQILLALAAVLLGRVLSVYGLIPVSNLFSKEIPIRWQHILVWGGLHGSLSLALALSLARDFPYRAQILAFTFGVVAFSIVAQGLTIQPVLRMLKISSASEDEYTVARVRQVALSLALSELDELRRTHTISAPAYIVLRGELEERHKKIQSEIERLFAEGPAGAEGEMRAAQSRLLAVVRSSVEQAIHDGVITPVAAAKIIDETTEQLDKLNSESTG